MKENLVFVYAISTQEWLLTLKNISILSKLQHIRSFKKSLSIMLVRSRPKSPWITRLKIFLKTWISTTRYSKKLFPKFFLKHFIQERQVAFEDVKMLKDNLITWKLYAKKLICNEVARCQPESLRKKLFHASSFMYFAFIFSECVTITSSKEALKVCEHNFFQRKVVLLVIYLSITIDLSQLSSCWIWHLTFSWAQFLSNK